jgi:exo-beta-1,3-glucanase (GH17 family)
MRKTLFFAVVGWALVALVLLTGGCGNAATGQMPVEPFVRRLIPADVLARRAVAYSGYRTGQSPDVQVYPSEAEIQEDLELLVRGGWGFIRLFDSGPHAERVLKVIHDHDLDLRVLLGVWISGKKAEHDAANRAELERAIAFHEQYPDVVVAISVGNETLDDWSNVRTPPAELAAYIQEVRSRANVPVTTDDSYLPFLLGSDGATSYADVIEVAKVCDFLSVHVYAFADAFYASWEWKQENVPEAERAAAMMAAAVAYTKQSIRDVRTTMAANGLADIPIVVGEWGWKSTTEFTLSSPPEDRMEVYFAHPVNQKIFYDTLMAWMVGAEKDADSPVASFYFEAFDEPWKGEWGDDHWGLFDVARKPKYLVWDIYPDLKPEGAPSYEAKDAVYYKATP